ncbi:MAG: AAA family ATPase [Candidatus Marinimicrobia bacterium]|nr:AAA family ATPase [Candidatus Neomarinimicrobiota bacterium]MCF7840095.1 AAA family ATPase [Candidatus Neomarinimicrobiota bacterium]MCF7902726.1 AAA family ATPase [Candidatus Neomarinimicrobiota bacterium]
MRKLDARDLCASFNPEDFPFKTTDDLKPLTAVIGQERAVRALELGLEMNGPGYNIFVGGYPGTGKATIIESIAKKFAAKRKTPPDLIVVNNFVNEYHPLVIELKAGNAQKFSKDMGRLIESLRQDLPRVFQGEHYQRERKKVTGEFNEKRSSLIDELNRKAEKQQIQVQYTEAGFQTIPMADKEPLSEEQYNQLTDAEKEKFIEAIKSVQTLISDTLREIASIDQLTQDALEKLNEDIGLAAVKPRIDHLKHRYPRQKSLRAYLDLVEMDIVSNLAMFLGQSADDAQAVENDGQEGLLPSENPFIRYRVNILVDNSTQKGGPVVFDSNPTYYNVFGRIEKRAILGGLITDFTMIQAGSLLRANGGILILDIESILQNPYVWEALKRSLRNQKVQIEDVNEQFGFSSVTSMKPEPIPLNVRVILIGRSDYFQYLQSVDDNFRKTFKVRADFDYEVQRSPSVEREYAAFIARVCTERELPAFTADGVAEILSHGSRLADDQTKLSLQFGELVSVIMESAHFAQSNDHNTVTTEDVQKAITERHFRIGLMEEKIQERYDRGTILVDTAGERTGQINGLAVYSIGESGFGKPVRITATTFMGKSGVINVERMAKLSGKTYDKGIYILSGYLGQIFAQEYPLSISISITFEQSYGGVDGDSASSTELYAILSSLSGYPIKQGIAVTGSVNQYGEVQPIGGVNEKIEGFFKVCNQKGLTGEQGVIIPEGNVEQLMLNREVTEAVAAGKFSIWSVSNIHEGIEILTGKPAGEMNKRGHFPRHSVYGEAQRKLKDYVVKSLTMKQRLAPGKKEKDDASASDVTD